MASIPNRPSSTPRRGQSSRRGYAPPIARTGTHWIIWALLGIVLVGGISVVAWRLQYQAKWKQADDKIMALIESAEKLIQENREDEAEAVAKQGLGLLPGDTRCEKVIERINVKRQMIHQRKVELSEATVAQAEQLAKTDIGLAIEAFKKAVEDVSLTPEARETAKARIISLQSGVCSLRMPREWPEDAVLTLGDTTQRVVDGLVSGIVPGKHQFSITRYGFSDPPPLELEFRGVEPLPFPAFAWKVRGAKVFVKSIPPGASVWWKGKDTGKTTPFEIEDVDDGPVEFLLKHPKYGETSLTGLVKDRQPLSLTATLKPSNGAK